jgi:peptide/nickel transport system permease protein
MLALAGRKLARVIGIALGATTFSFFLLLLVPGDPLAARWGRPGDPQRRAVLQAELHLDQAAPLRYLHYLGRVARGDLGRSLTTREPVARALWQRAAPTALLVGSAFLLALSLGLLLGAAAAVRPRGAWDRSLPLICALLLAVPSFLAGYLLLLLFSVQLGWTPISGLVAGEWSYLVLPSLALALRPIALIARSTRREVETALRQEACRSARARGGRGLRLLLRYGLAPAAVPLLEVAGAVVSSLLAGTYFVEFVFGWPGLGQWTLRAVESLDVFAIQGAVLVTATTATALHAALELCGQWLDPRRRP